MSAPGNARGTKWAELARMEQTLLVSRPAGRNLPFRPAAASHLPSTGLAAVAVGSIVGMPKRLPTAAADGTNLSLVSMASADATPVPSAAVASSVLACGRPLGRCWRRLPWDRTWDWPSLAEPIARKARAYSTCFGALVGVTSQPKVANDWRLMVAEPARLLSVRCPRARSARKLVAILRSFRVFPRLAHAIGNHVVQIPERFKLWPIGYTTAPMT
jgi:hypothetical protein